MYIQTHINKHIYKTKVLTKPEDIARGMMGRKFTSQFDALLFVINTPSPKSFWMKNCIVPLDVIFIENGKTTIPVLCSLVIILHLANWYTE